MKQPTLFDGARATLAESIEQTELSLQAYGERYKHWAIAYSGGKDSSAALTVVVHMIRAGRVPTPETLTVLYADTRMELPPLHLSAMKMLDVLSAAGIETKIVLPELDERFFVYMFGRGVPPPKNRFRWCTDQIKIRPMVRAMQSLRDQAGEKLLMLTGVRIGESVIRDQRIIMSCSRDGAECGQGWFQTSTPESVADTLAPLLHWRVCHVWDWLSFDAPAYGFPTRDVAVAYGGDEAVEAQCRTGCVGCNLASRDKALETILRKYPKYSYLAPLLELRPLYAELTTAMHRIRKTDETKSDGSFVKNIGRMGPLRMESRLYGLGRVKDIQDRIEANRPSDLGGINLINDEEEARIIELINANTWPNKWTGDEQPADQLFEQRYHDGTIQQIFDFSE